MDIVIAIDSFKGSLSTFEAGKAIKEAANEVYKGAEVVISPIADGGEGTVEAIISAVKGKLVNTITDVDFDEFFCMFVVSPNGKIITIPPCSKSHLSRANKKRFLIHYTKGVISHEIIIPFFGKK